MKLKVWSHGPRGFLVDAKAILHIYFASLQVSFNMLQLYHIQELYIIHQNDITQSAKTQSVFTQIARLDSTAAAVKPQGQFLAYAHLAHWFNQPGTGRAEAIEVEGASGDNGYSRSFKNRICNGRRNISIQQC